MRYHIPDIAPEAWHSTEIEVEKSQFLTWLCHAPSTSAFDALLQAAKIAHPNASHHCTAFIAGPPGSRPELAFRMTASPAARRVAPCFRRCKVAS